MPLCPGEEWNPSIWLGRSGQCGANHLRHGETAVAGGSIPVCYNWAFSQLTCDLTNQSANCQTGLMVEKMR